MDPLPAAEVRRRGNRMRRRHHALAAVAGVAAVAVIATPLAMAAGDRGSGGAPDPANPSRTPQTSWVTAVPNGFDISSGYPEATGHDGSDGVARDFYEQETTDACEGEGWTPDGTTDLRQATYTDPSEGGLDRTLALYPSGSAAAQALQALTGRVQQCAAATAGRPRTADLVGSEPETLVYADHLSDAGDMYVHRVVRVGNALLLDSAYAQGGGDPQVVRQTAAQIEQRSAATVTAMCSFAADPC